MNKIFGIGMGRTATHSLTKALQLLGYNVIHYPKDDETMLHIQNGYFKLPILEKCDGLTDTVAVPYYSQFDALYPGSKFILTVRERASWLRSIERNHNGVSEYPLNRNERMTEMRRFYRAACWGTYRFNRDRYVYVYDQHCRNVMDYFKDRPADLLVLDICAGDGWDLLCPFLNQPIPDQPFPRERIDSAKGAPSSDAKTARSIWGRIQSAIRR